MIRTRDGVDARDAAPVPWGRSSRQEHTPLPFTRRGLSVPGRVLPSQVLSGVIVPGGVNEWGRLSPLDRLPVIRVEPPSAPDMWG